MLKRCQKRTATCCQGATTQNIFLQAGLPDGVLNIVHGAKPTVDFICDHPAIKVSAPRSSVELSKSENAPCVRTEQKWCSHSPQSTPLGAN